MAREFILIFLTILYKGTICYVVKKKIQLLKTDELLQKENQPNQLKSQINDFDNTINNDIRHPHNRNFCLVGQNNP